MKADSIDRPVVRALIARKLPHGRFGKSRIVSLATAYVAMRSGSFAVVGPDLEDMARLATWERKADTMKKDEVPECAHCDTSMKPERVGAVRYICTVCSRVTIVPKG